MPGRCVYGSGVSRILVYPSAYAGTNQATAVSFEIPVAAFGAEVAALRAKGIVFQTLSWLGSSVPWPPNIRSRTKRGGCG